MHVALSDDSPQPDPTTPVEVGVRELRDNLSRYIDLVAAGGEVIVTNHGKKVARLGPVGGIRKIDELIAAGLVTPPRSRTRTIPIPLDLGVTVSDLVIDQRR